MNFLPGVRSSLYLGEVVCHAISVSYEKCWGWHNTCQRLRRKSWSFVVRRGYGGGRSACTHLSVSRACRLSGQRSSSGLDEIKTQKALPKAVLGKQTEGL